MPVTCKLIDKKWRVVEAKSGAITPSDKEGHDSKEDCMAQARAINANIKDVVNQMQEICLYGIAGYDYSAQSVSLISGQPAFIKINSKGGSVFDAIQIYNMIRMHNAEVTTYIEGVALSAAAIIAMAGHKVQMAANSLMMIHGPELTMHGDADEEVLRKTADILSKVKDSLVTTLCGRTGKKAEEISAMLDNDTWMTAQEAKEGGFVDEIIETSLKRPEIENLSGIPERIVAIFRGGDLMSLKDLAAKLQVTITKDCDDVKISNLIVEMFEGMKPKPKTSASQGVLNMAKELRQAKINNLVSEGKIIPAVAEDLVSRYCSEDALKNAFGEDGVGTDTFDVVVNIISKNAPVVTLGGVKPLPKPEDSEANILVKNMEGRLK